MEMQLIVGVLTVDLFIPSAGSLKDKRIVVKSLKDRLRNKFNVSVAEVDYQDKWQRARLGIAVVGGDYKFVEKNLNAVFNLIDSNISLEITDHNFEFL